ncbi:MAG: pseudouridine synthase [Rectinemataceae bacterium]|jgi:23S rRNA pseudouridine1911/1915/1917 synthase
MDLIGEELLEPRVLYEDSSLIAVLKPTRMHSVPGLGVGDLCAWIFERYPEVREAGKGVGRTARSLAEGGLLHRLDYETSGIALFARNTDAFISLLQQQERGTFHKEYLAFSGVSSESYPLGSVPQEGFPGGVAEDAWTEAREGLDVASLAALLDAAVKGGSCVVSCSFRSFGPKGSRVACLRPDTGQTKKAGATYRSEILGYSAFSTRFDPMKGGSALELRIRLSRGFRHQIRAQLAWIGLPISGDSLYGGAADERLRLYAVGLAFEHPLTGEAFSLSTETRRESLVAFRTQLR